MNESLDKFDLIVMGAGISGLGLAMAAIEKGLRVCIVERDKVSRRTSNSSLRIIHGGLRYLQKFDFSRVYESAGDQAYCLKTFPAYIQPLNCVLPLSGKGFKKPCLVKIAAALYSAVLLSVRSAVKSPEVQKSAGTGLDNIFNSVSHKGFLCWQDAVVSDPVHFAEFLKSEILAKGGKLLEHTVCNNISESAEMLSLAMTDSANDIQFSYSSRYIVNCLGPQVPEFYSGFNCKWAMAFNLILNKKYNDEVAFAVDGAAGRNFFFVPRDDKTVLGTDYYELDGPLEAPSEEKVRDFVEAASRALPSLDLQASDIVSIEWGVIPVKGFKSATNPDFLGSALIEKKGRVVHILSTKYTGFRSQALKVLDLLEE